MDGASRWSGWASSCPFHALVHLRTWNAELVSKKPLNPKLYNGKVAREATG